MIYDIEIFINCFLVIFYNEEENKYYLFQINKYKDERKELLSFLSNLEYLIGFNCLHFDVGILNKLIITLNSDPDISPLKLCRILKDEANHLIKLEKAFNIEVIPQIDLFKICHFDNKAKMTSLKALEFVLRMENIQELPFPHTARLSKDDIDTLIMYCINDINTTIALKKKKESAIRDRKTYSELYNINMMSWNDPKIGEFLLINRIKKSLKKEYLGKTIRESIKFEDIILPYIEFYQEPFNDILEWFKNKEIKETKNVFTKMPLEEFSSLTHYEVSKREIKSGKLDNLNVLHKNFRFDFGTGGLHGAITGIFESDKDYIIKSCDVKSLYPNISIVNGFYPEHCTPLFCDIYKEIYEERLKYPKETHPEQNALLKLALNGAYGKSNSKFSELFDSKFTMSITINGQLLMCMLAESVMDIPESKLLMVNTDGLEILIPRKYEKLYEQICKEWENKTKLCLEYVDYDKLIIKNVNNYLGIYTDGKVKHKGDYVIDRELHQDHSMLVIPKAVEAYYVNNVPIEEFIKNHNDIFDFFKRVKLKGESVLVERSKINNDRIEQIRKDLKKKKSNKELLLTELLEILINDTVIQKLSRYIVTKEGEVLIKKMPPLNDNEYREFNIEKNQVVKVYNNLSSVNIEEIRSNINYEYYIEEAKKLLIE